MKLFISLMEQGLLYTISGDHVFLLSLKLRNSFMTFKSIQINLKCKENIFIKLLVDGWTGGRWTLTGTRTKI